MILCRSHEQLHRVTVVRRCLWKVQPLCLEKAQLEQTARDHVQLGFEYLQGWTLQNLLGQSFPILDHPRSKEKGFL